MSTKEPGIHDADDWISYWTSLHRSDLFWGAFNSLALRRLEGDALAEGVGSETLTVDDGGLLIEVEVKYLVEQFPKGRIFHVVSIRSPGDPLPPPVSDKP
jgi:hypothetical protein